MIQYPVSLKLTAMEDGVHWTNTSEHRFVFYKIGFMWQSSCDRFRRI